VERELEYWAPGATEPRLIRVHIGTPVQDFPTVTDTAWSCTLTIEGFEKPYSKRFYQVDAIGAMLAAAAIAPIELRSFVAPGGRLTWLESEVLGFALLSPPSGQWQFHPADGNAPRKVSVEIGHPERIGESWSALVTLIDYGRADEDDEYATQEKRVHGATWEKALELAAASVPAFLQEHVDKAGGGTLVEADDTPVCRVRGAAKQ
jgi:hypothetical protein